MAKNCFIYETLNNVKEMTVKKDGDLMTLSGVFGVCGVRNNNQRVYETSNYSSMVTEMKERIAAEGGIPGELEHPKLMNITLENVSHKITDINIDENGVVTGSVTLLNTPKGKIAQAIVEGGLPLFISSRATGNVDAKTGNVTLEKIATYDLVGSPGFSQAKLKLNENQIAECINESQVYYITEKEENNIEDNMNPNELLEKFSALEARITALESENNELKETIESLTEASEEKLDIKQLAEGVQNWIINEYTPKVQEWMEEYYMESVKEEIAESAEIDYNKITENVAKKMAPGIENWVINEFAPEVEKWCVNEFAPGIQEWAINEFAPEVENWMNESYSPKIQESISEAIAESKKNNLSAIDETLQLLENLEVTKPTYGKKSIITENADEPKYIQEMPADVRVKWDMASDEIKESINRRAKLYNFVSEGSIERFWNSINFENIKPVSNIYEGLANIEDEYERNIRAKLRASRFRKF